MKFSTSSVNDNPDQAPALQARNLWVSYRRDGVDLDAVKDVSLSVQRGEVLAIIGESGSGKSTLARSLLGMTPARSGELAVNGIRVPAAARDRDLDAKRALGMVFQDSSAAFNPRFTVQRILNETMALLSPGSIDTRQLRMKELLETVGLSETFLGRFPHELSGGQRQRVGIARALAGKPQVLICDEAVSALDVSVQAQILNLLVDLQVRYKLAMIFITHDLGVVSYMADQVGVMLQGELVETGPLDKIFDSPKHLYTRSLLMTGKAPVGASS